MNELRLKNENVLVIYDQNDITVYMLKDINETTAYTKSKRNLKKCWEYINKTFNEKTTFNEITSIFVKYDIRYNRYCGLD